MMSEAPAEKQTVHAYVQTRKQSPSQEARRDKLPAISRLSSGSGNRSLRTGVPVRPSRQFVGSVR